MSPRNGTGVKPASKTSIRIAFTYRDVECKERIKLPPTPANIKRCERHRAAILESIYRGDFNYTETFPNSKKAKLFAESQGDVLTVASRFDSWLTAKKNLLHTSTYTDYKNIVNNQLCPEFGHLLLSEIKKKHVRKWAQSLKCSNKRIANLISPLKNMLQQACDDDLIDSNPIANWSYKKAEPPKKNNDKDPFTKKEQIAILNAIKEPQGKNLIQFMLWSGLRPSEAIALRWEDVDWVHGTISINKAKTQRAKKEEATKTASSTRIIKMLPPALDAMKDQKIHTFMQGDIIFNNPRTGQQWKGDQPLRKTLWTHALKKAGVRYRSLKQTRHTFASMMISSGENIRWISKYLGHSDMTTTLRVYAQWLNDADPNAGSKAVDNFGYRNIAETTSSKLLI